MKLLFVHDHPFYDENGSVYSGGGLPHSTWDNYLYNFDEVVVFGRHSNNAKDRKVISSAANVSFSLTEKYSSIVELIKNRNGIERTLLSLIEGSDVVLIRLPSVLGFIASDLAAKKGKPLWVEQVGSAREALSSHGSLLGKLAAPVFEYQNRKAVGKANFVSYVTEKKLQGDYPSHKRAITVALSNVIIHQTIEEHDVNTDRFFAYPFKIGLIGGFDVRYKGQDILLKAVAGLPDKFKSNIEFYLVGKGDHQWVLDLASDLALVENIKFIGPKESGSQIFNFLQQMSLYIQPSLTEGMPRALLEAMSMGCPVLGSDVGGIPDVVAPEFIHKKGDIVGVRNHLFMLIEDREKLLSESLRSIKKVQPFLKAALDRKRKDFYTEMNKSLSKKVIKTPIHGS